MPKLSKIQSNFNSGEVSQNVYGRVDSERYDSALSLCLNYVPLLQGPLIRRAGTKFVTNVKDSTKPPVLIPFNFNGTQSYILEFGDKYIRFFANDGQVITNTTVFKVAGNIVMANVVMGNLNFSAARSTPYPETNEIFVSSSVIAPGSIFEIDSPYSVNDVPLLRYAQKEGTLYITHPAYPTAKLVKFDTYDWDIRPVMFQDGPYLPLNSYETIADSAGVTLSPQLSSGSVLVVAGPSNQIGATSASPEGFVRITTVGSSFFSTGQKVFVQNVAGTIEANNGTSSISASYWVARAQSSNQFDLLGSHFTNALVGSTGTVFPALFQMYQAPIAGSSPVWADALKDSSRVMGLYINGVRSWGVINTVLNPAKVLVTINSSLPSSGVASIWSLGTFNAINGYPATTTFHQNRLFFSGSPIAPQQIDGSYISQYENFAASGSNLQVTDANALQFSLLSNESSPIYWLKSVAQGLLAGSFASEWQISPNTQSPGLTPTNFSAQKISSFGSGNIDAVQLANSVLYLQAAQRRLRELNYFVQVGTFRSTNLSELSEHITLPSMLQLAVQKEPHPVIWGLRADGNLVSLSYSRDDVTLKSGFAQHQLGGQSDSAGTPPTVKAIAIANASSALHNELWMTVARSVNGSSFVSIEYMTRTFSENALQEDAYYLDCGATFDNPLPVTAVTNAASCVITSPAHGLTNSSLVRFYTAVGLNSSSVDVNGNKSISNLLNGNTFTVASASINTFKIMNQVGADVSSLGYTSYLGSSVVRKLITNISGLTWLAGDTVSILADGGIHPDVIVNSAGTVHLSYPAAKVQIGYTYNSDAQLLRTKEGSAQGTSIASTRRVNRVGFMLHNVAELSYGQTFTNMLPVEFPRADVNAVDTASPLNNGVFREGFQGTYTYDDAVCIRQSAPLPGTIQSIVRFLEEQDV